MDKITLQPASLADAEEIMVIEKSASGKTYSALKNAKAILDCLKNNVVFLIKKGQTVIGSVNYEIIKKNHARIESLALYPKFRGYGYAYLALKSLLKKMNKYKRVDLTVHPHNIPAIKTYLALGFIIESWKDNCYGDGEPRLIMVKR